MSDTPETDAELNAIKSVIKDEFMLETMADFARKLERERDQLLEASKAVVARWDMPSWKDAEPTGVAIYKLRDAVYAITGENGDDK